MHTPLLLALLLLAAPPELSARGKYYLPFADMIEESDVVCIGTFASTQKVDVPITDPDFLGSNPADIDVYATEFKVMATMKGKIASESIELIHYAYAPHAKAPGNGPLFIDFNDPPYPNVRVIKPLNRWQRLPKPDPRDIQYLLFLKSTPSGRFDPIGGQLDLDISIRRVEEVRE